MTPKKLPVDHNKRVPAPADEYRHYLPIQIRFTDIDSMGHVNNAVYLNYMDLGKTRYFEDVMDGDIDWHNIGVVVVNLNCSYFAQTLYGENIEVLTTINHIGEKSLTMEQRVVNSDTLETKAVCFSIMAGFDRNTAKSAPIGPVWTEAIERFEGRKLTSK
ncbi:MAG: acyl-CoA thioesterase [Lachnoclostridium sp.]|nr:acyl-CoA thioesterase [Lachnoclostridium sp.]